jgi:hypothetical protein
MFSTRAFVAVCLLVVSITLGQNKFEERRIGYSATTQPSSVADQATRQKLQTKLGPMKLSGDALADAVDRLRDAASLDIYVNWRALDALKVTRDLPLTIDLSGLRAWDALDALLEHVGGDFARLGWSIDDGVVTISSRRDLSKNTLTRVYDIRGAIRGQATRQADIDAVIRRVRGIDPLSWRDAGGEIGSVRELQGQLIVTQTPQVQQRILQELRDIQKSDQPFPLKSSRRGS